MKRFVESIVRALVVMLLFVPAPLVALDTTPAYAAPADGLVAQPAVEVPEAEEADEEDPWTARFLAPAVVVIAAITVGASLAYYVVRIRGRYRVVQ